MPSFLQTMSKKMLFIVLGTVAILLAFAVLAFSDESTPDVETLVPTSNLNILRLMDDAPISERQYRVSIDIETDYKVSEIYPYYFSPNASQLLPLPSFQHVKTNSLDLSFRHAPASEEYLVLHIKYGPRFVFNRYSEAVCIARFDAGQIFHSMPCNTTTTAEYMVAHTMMDEPSDDVINYKALQHYLQVLQYPKIESYQNYLALLTLLQGHLAESPQYSTVSANGLFLKTLIPFAKRVQEDFLKRRRLDVDDFDRYLNEVDLSMTSMAYRLYRSLDSLLLRHTQGLPDVKERKSYLTNFLSGFAPLGIHDPQAFELPSLNVYKNTINFRRWPWQDSVQLNYANQKKTITDTQFEFPVDVTTAFIRPMSGKNRFPVQQLALKSSLAMDDLEMETTERLDVIISELTRMQETSETNTQTSPEPPL